MFREGTLDKIRFTDLCKRRQKQGLLLEEVRFQRYFKALHYLLPRLVYLVTRYGQGMPGQHQRCMVLT